MSRQLLAATLLLSANACVGKRINNAMASWEGHHYSDLIMSWGPPQQVFEDGSRGRILIWTAVRSYTAPGRAVRTTSVRATAHDNYIWGQARSFTEYRPPQTYGYTAWRMFRISSRGRVISWSWRGL